MDNWGSYIVEGQTEKADRQSARAGRVGASEWMGGGAGQHSGSENGSFRRGWTESQVACVRSNQWRRGMMMTAASRGRTTQHNLGRSGGCTPYSPHSGRRKQLEQGWLQVGYLLPSEQQQCYLPTSTVGTLLTDYVPRLTTGLVSILMLAGLFADGPGARSRAGKDTPGRAADRAQREWEWEKGGRGEGKGAQPSQVSASLQDLGGRPHVTLDGTLGI